MFATYAALLLANSAAALECNYSIALPVRSAKFYGAARFADSSTCIQLACPLLHRLCTAVLHKDVLQGKRIHLRMLP